mmetsp:Transcript_24109/g.44746  ORF Transcript_24109/g.44746 Transcript_24109/m.44746 type:complete len:318 (+) Transcript_24109:69-1022(+)
MKPQFALSLSFDGIRLLLRAAGGWQVVGEAPVDSPDLSGQLAALRQKAFELRPGRVRTKLIIPEEQIRYLSVPTGDVDHATRMDAARLALDGSTPYPVDALAFDISPNGVTTHVAAVARETLAEAEAFASEHNFNPVSFVSAPENAGFLGEPYFGMTAAAKARMADGRVVEPDGVRVVVTGPVVLPEAEARIDKAAPTAPDLSEGPQGAARVEQPESHEPPAPDITEPDAPAGTAPEAPEAQVTAVKDAAQAPTTKQPAPPPPPDAKAPEPHGVAALGFASRRGSPITAAAPLGGVTRDAQEQSATTKAVPIPAQQR